LCVFDSSNVILRQPLTHFLQQLTNGIWGTIAVGLFAVPELLSNVYNSSTHVGWFYSWGMGSADGTLLACQVIGVLFVTGWVICMMLPFFWLLHYFGYLRADALEEVIGLDVAYRGGMLDSNDDQDEETKKKMDDYIKEYEHRKAEKAHFLQMNDNRSGSLFSRTPIPASSLHNENLHGHSFHGRRVIAAGSLDASKTSRDSHRSRSRNEMGEVNVIETIDVEQWIENARD